jgi:hypothetical protein
MLRHTSGMVARTTGVCIIRSSSWAHPVALTIHNDTSSAIKVYWLNYDGASYLTEPWPDVARCPVCSSPAH